MARREIRKRKQLLFAVYFDDKGGLIVVRHKGLTPDMERTLCNKMINGHSIAQAISAQ